MREKIRTRLQFWDEKHRARSMNWRKKIVHNFGARSVENVARTRENTNAFTILGREA